MFFVRLCALMRQRYGSVIHLYCVTEQERRYYEKLNQDGLFASITNVIGLMEAATRPVTDPDAVLARARAHEDHLGTTYNVLFAANRHFGRGFRWVGSAIPGRDIRKALTICRSSRPTTKQSPSGRASCATRRSRWS